MTRLTQAAVVVCIASAAAPSASADSPCIHRFTGGSVNTASLNGASLTYCTGETCWSFDTGSRTVTPITAVPPVASLWNPTPDARAIAELDHATFCPRPAKCDTFKYSFHFEAADAPRAFINAAGTLGAVTYTGVDEAGDPPWVLLFDLASHKARGKVRGYRVQVLANAFVVSDGMHVQLYTPHGAKLAPVDGDPVVELGPDLIAESLGGQVSIQNERSGKVVHVIALEKTKDPGAILLAASADGSELYAIQSDPDEGEVVVIDVATGDIKARVSPPVCAAGTGHN